MGTPLLIGGKLVPGGSGLLRDDQSATEAVLGHAANASAEDMDAAVGAAQNAFAETDWSHDPGGRVTLGAGFGWNTDELTDHGVPPNKRRTVLREYVEAMRELWTQEEASYDGQYVSFGPSWAWPKPIQSHVPVLVGAAGTEKTFQWIARSGDGWITTPTETDISVRLELLQKIWADAGRSGRPRVVALDFKPDPDKLARWSAEGVTDVLYGLPDRSTEEVLHYLDRLSAKLAALDPSSRA